MTKIRKFGLIEEEYQSQDNFFGGIGGPEKEVLQANGQWHDYLPVKELQHSVYFDTLGCVTFSALNCLEILAKRKFKYEPNYSDRYIAKLSGTNNFGNTFGNVRDAIKKYGLIKEEDYPYPTKMREPRFTKAEYYQEVPADLILKGESWLDRYDIGRPQWVGTQPENLILALEEAPLQVTIYAFTKPVNGIYPDNTKKRNHAVTLMGYKWGEWWEIFDHYENVMKKLEWDYNFGAALKYSLTIKQNPPMKLDNNILVQEVEVSGQFGLHLDGKIYIDDLDKILATWLQRNNGDVIGKTKSLKREDWDKFPQYDLKNNKI